MSTSFPVVSWTKVLGNCIDSWSLPSFLFIKTQGMSLLLTARWKNGLLRGRESVEDYERSGCPKESTTDETVDLVQNLIMCDRRRSLRDIARYISISFGAVQDILTDVLGMSKVSARAVRSESSLGTFVRRCHSSRCGSYREHGTSESGLHRVCS